MGWGERLRSESSRVAWSVTGGARPRTTQSHRSGGERLKTAPHLTRIGSGEGGKTPQNKNQNKTKKNLHSHPPHHHGTWHGRSPQRQSQHTKEASKRLPVQARNNQTNSLQTLPHGQVDDCKSEKRSEPPQKKQGEGRKTSPRATPTVPPWSPAGSPAEDKGSNPDEANIPAQPHGQVCTQTRET